MCYIIIVNPMILSETGMDHGAAKDGAHGEHDMQGHAGHAGGMINVHSRAVVEETPSGARLAFIAIPSAHAKLRDEVGVHARHMASGSCAMAHE